MSTGNPTFGSKVLSSLEIEWAKKLAEVEETADPKGRGIDEGIKNAVVAFNVNGISTTASCEGHSEVKGGHTPWPWISVAAQDEPEERFVGEVQAFIDAAKLYVVPLEELKRGQPEDLYWEVKKRIIHGPETPEYKKWGIKNQELHTRTVGLLEEFYSDREVDEDIRLRIDEFHGDSFEVRSVRYPDFLVRFLDNELSDEEKKKLLDLLPRRQKEMQDFAAFLKVKFLNKQ